MAAERVIPAPVKWAQRKDCVYVTINLEDCKDANIELKEDRLSFKGTGGTNSTKHENIIEFFEEVDPKESKYIVQQRNIPMMIKKKGAAYWPRLLKDKSKVHWLKTDFDKWRDEDDSDVDEGQDMQLEEMMKQMGNFKATDDLNAENEEDSDDEDLPDLEGS